MYTFLAYTPNKSNKISTIYLPLPHINRTFAMFNKCAFNKGILNNTKQTTKI